MTLRSNVDSISGSRIQGWAWDEERPRVRLRIIARDDANLVGSAQADKYREDLKNAGIGDGCHGFELFIPNLSMTSGPVHIVEMQSGEEITGSPVWPPESRSAPEALHIIVDITDLLLFLDKTNRLTGIPRVQVELLKALVQQSGLVASSVELAAISWESRKLELVDQSDFLDFLENYLGPEASIRPDSTGKAQIARYLKFRPFHPDSSYCQKSIFIAPGSPWSIPDFFAVINKYLARGMRLFVLYHDIIPIVRPDLCPPELIDLFNIFVPSSMMYCDGLFAVSQYCAQNLEDFARKNGYNCPPVTVTGNGATAFPQPAEAPAQTPFVLVVSTLEERKNHLLLAKVWQALVEKHGTAIPKLVFCGKTGESIQPLHDFLKQTSCLEGHIEIIQDASDAALGQMYKDCLFTAYPSLCEGWGLPVTESLTMGKTCLCSNATSLPQAGGDHCVYFDPENLEEATLLAEKLIFDHAWRTSLEEHIRKTYVPPSWRSVAQILLDRTGEMANIKHRPPIPIEEGMEVPFWLPEPYPEDRTQRIPSIAKFSRGLLSADKLKWKSYCLATGIMGEGRFFPRTEEGWTGDADGNSFRITLGETCEENATVYLLVGLSQYPCTLEFYGCNRLLGTLAATSPICLATLPIADTRVGSNISFSVKPRNRCPIIFKSLLILNKMNLEKRLSLQERLWNIATTKHQIMP